MATVKNGISHLALAAVLTAGIAAGAPGPDTAEPPANSLRTEMVRKISAPPVDSDCVLVGKEMPVLRNVSFQRYRP